MKNKESDFILSIFFKAILVILILFIILSILTSLVTGISIFNIDIFRTSLSVFLYALIVLASLFLFVAILLTIISKFTPYEIFNRENIIVCNIKDKRKRQLIDISNINEYLDKYKSLNIIDNLTIRKKNKNKKLSSNNLLIIDDNDNHNTLSKIYRKDIQLYEKITGFLKDISKFNVEELFWKMDSYINKKETDNKIIDITNDLSILKKKISDKTINDDINTLIKSLDNNDNIKIINNYIPILIKITNKYAYLEKNDYNSNEFINLHNNLHQIYKTINNLLNNEIVDEENSEINNLETILARQVKM